jgi:hypothetical protein
VGRGGGGGPRPPRVASGYFHRWAVLSTLDELGRHTCKKTCSKAGKQDSILLKLGCALRCLSLEVTGTTCLDSVEADMYLCYSWHSSKSVLQWHAVAAMIAVVHRVTMCCIEPREHFHACGDCT